MRVFVTGATGFIGSAIVKDLIDAGHQVLGLARSDAGAKSLIAVGAQVHRGDLQDLESLRVGAARSNAVIHTAFIHDFSNYTAAAEADRLAIEALGAALGSSDRPLIVTSGTALLTPGRLATEGDAPPIDGFPRESEKAAASLAVRGVRVSVVLLPPSVHGDGDHGFVPLLMKLANQKGVSAYVGDALNRWPAVHLFDAARLYRFVLDKGSGAATYHGVAEEGVPFRDIAGAIGRQLNVPVVAKTPEEATNHFGWFAHLAAIDNPTSSLQTRALLGWEPKQPGLIPDIDRSSYFKA
jgi:nucleoside-diphosphate-sugar epimerase